MESSRVQGHRSIADLLERKILQGYGREFIPKVGGAVIRVEQSHNIAERRRKFRSQRDVLSPHVVLTPDVPSEIMPSLHISAIYHAVGREYGDYYKYLDDSFRFPAFQFRAVPSEEQTAAFSVGSAFGTVKAKMRSPDDVSIYRFDRIYFANNFGRAMRFDVVNRQAVSPEENLSTIEVFPEVITDFSWRMTPFSATDHQDVMAWLTIAHDWNVQAVTS